MKSSSYQLLARLDHIMNQLSHEDKRESSLVFITVGVVTMRRLGLSDEVILNNIKKTMVSTNG